MPNNNQPPFDNNQPPYNPFQNNNQGVNPNAGYNQPPMQNTPGGYPQNPVPNQYTQTPQMPQQASTEEYPQDPRIVDYLLHQVIPAKNPGLPADQVVTEKDRLYKILEAGIFETAYNQLAEEQKDELDTLMKYGADIPAIQAFFIEKIPNIQLQLGKYMEEFVQKYLRGEI